MATDHPQMPVLDFECDEEIAELITLMNNLGIVLVTFKMPDGVKAAKIQWASAPPAPTT